VFVIYIFARFCNVIKVSRQDIMHLDVRPGRGGDAMDPYKFMSLSYVAFFLQFIRLDHIKFILELTFIQMVIQYIFDVAWLSKRNLGAYIYFHMCIALGIFYFCSLCCTNNQ
jgi:hypothetical protein